VIGLIKSAQVNASPSEVFTVIEDALRSHFAKPIPAKAEHLSANQQIISR
jgi:hypothetical protein